MGKAAGLPTVAEDLRAVYATGKTRAYEWRVSQLKELLSMTTRCEKEIREALCSDFSKPEHESYLHEIVGISASCNLALKNLRQWMMPERVNKSVVSFPSSAMIVPEPLGVVLVIISTWNYPLTLSLEPVIGAIAAGNAVVLKPSEVAPALPQVLMEYMDASAVKVIEGAVPEVTVLLEQKWDTIFYTGSSNMGRMVMAAAAKHLTPVVLELGGKSPLVVDSNIDLQDTAKQIISGKWGSNNRYICTSSDYILTTKAYALKLVEVLSSELEKFDKDALQSNMFSCMNSDHFNCLVKLLEDEKIAGKVVLGGQLDRANLKVGPTIILDAPQDSLIMNEDTFGPLLPIITVNKFEDCISFINSREKPLAAYLFTNNDKLKEEFIRNVTTGGMCISDTSLRFAERSLPFRGIGGSGMVSYHGKHSFDTFSHKKSVVQRGLKGNSAIGYLSYTRETLRFLKAMLSGNRFRILRALLGF